MLRHHSNTHRLSLTAQKGFTVIEVLIATVIFSVLLLIITYGVMSFTNDYYKGVNSSTAQNTARSVVDAVSQAIQFGGVPVSQPMSGGLPCHGSTTCTFCINSKQFDFTLYKEVGTAPGQISDALWESPLNQVGGASCSSVAAGPNSQSLIGPHMRLQKFTITPGASGTNTYYIDVEVVYGDDDLLCDTNLSGDCDSNSVSPHLTSPTANIACKLHAGSQYCYVANLSTAIQMRVQPVL
ncbi:MAG TPA: prepilin-type N-terminal cleavage/methylation domain-containing protein [Candidatus Saccharimonadales bacterium]|nr:prepilin-type N-terminal cleavage/methylation domain-containing protein [Candidatus Saccharimonadales bacterium]